MSQFSYPQYQKQYNRCKQCFKLIVDNTGLQEPICGTFYCPRCLCTIFQSHYIDPQKDIIVELYCGHYVDRQTIEKAIAQYCINCGNKFDRRVDVQMKQGVKLCRGCFDHHSVKYNDFLNQCVSCNRIIRLRDFLAGTQIMLCKDCATQQSEIQATTFSQSPAAYKQEERKPEVHKQSPKSQQNIEKSPSSPPQKDNISKGSLRSSSSRGQDDLPEDISIVSRFSALEIEQHQSSKDVEGEGRGMRKVKLTSKHSMDIRVENLKINVPLKSKTDKICQICGSLVHEQGLILDSQNKLQCKVCYMQTFDPRESGFYRSFARTSTANSRDKFSSAPKNKRLLGDNLNDGIREMKKSMNSGGKSEISSPYPPKPTQHLTVSQATKPSIWELPGRTDRLCDICKAKDYKITRVDKKKVCQDCYYKP